MPHGSCILRQFVVCLKKEELEISGNSQGGTKMYTAFSPGTKNLFLVLSAACYIVAFFLMDAMRKEQKRRKWVCGILLCILVAIAVAGFHEAKQSAGVLSAVGWI